MHILIEKYEPGNMRMLAASVVLVLCMIIFYINIGQTIEPESYVGHICLIVVALCLVQYATGQNLFSLSCLPHVLVGISWCITFPLLYFWSYHTTWFVAETRMDFLFGLGMFVLLIASEALCFLHKGQAKWIAWLFSCLDILCLGIPFAESTYYLLFQHCLTPSTLMALYLTSPRESIDFLQSNFTGLCLFAIAVGAALLLTAAYVCNRRVGRQIIANHSNRRKKWILLVLSVAMLVYVPFFLFPETSIIMNWKDVSAHVHETQKYSTHYMERLQDLRLTTDTTLAQKAPGTVIMVIGESASRNYMKAYTPSVPYDNTPWLEKCMQNPYFTVFHNVYSSWVQTVPVLERALTEESQYNDKEFIESTSLIDVAKKAGYETYWFSNQGRYGQYDSAITLVAKTADHAEWTDDAYELSNQFDETLLQFLPFVDATKNNFIVLHLMGSHIYYHNRYPENFEKWKSGDNASTEEAYANSTLYTDYILSQIYQYARDNMNLQAMVYYSDHGEDLHISHNPDAFRFDMVRIPMFVYLSENYRQAYPLQAATLEHNENQFFTNDMIYDTVCGILNAPSNHYDAGQDFSSQEYRFEKQDLTTMLGQKKLTEDPYLTGTKD